MRKLAGALGLLLILSALTAFAIQLPELPQGAKTRWIVQEPEEIVSYMVFDPATVRNRLPASLRFITISELAQDHIRWATDHLKTYPGHGDWGIAFFEIVRAGRFEIDGRALKLKKGEAMALWCARVAPSGKARIEVRGRPYLMLNFWVPDRAYASYMCSKGHFAQFGSVTLKQNADGRWRGSVNMKTVHLSVECECVGDVRHLGSGGMQTFFPPANSRIDDVVIVSFAGHKERLCGPDTHWTVNGTHPLASAMFLGDSTLQFGYTLIGGAYNR